MMFSSTVIVDTCSYLSHVRDFVPQCEFSTRVCGQTSQYPAGYGLPAQERALYAGVMTPVALRAEPGL